MKILTLNHLETHDRFLDFTQKHNDYISKGCQDCIDNRPEEFGNQCFYIFAHARTDDDGVTKRLIWSPRLTKPQAQSNSMLFKWYHPDIIHIKWVIPAEELFSQFSPEKMTHNPTIWSSIVEFMKDQKRMSQREEDDASEEMVKIIYTSIAHNSKFR